MPGGASRSQSDPARSRWGRAVTWLPAAFFLVGVAVVASLWGSVQRAERRRVDLETHITAEQVGLRLEAFVDARTALVRYLAGVGYAAPEEILERFSVEAGSLVGLFPDLQALNYVDSQWVIRVVVPEASNAPALGQDLHAHRGSGVVEAVARAEAERRLTRTPIVDLLQGGRGFGTYLPIPDGYGGALGFVNGVFRIDRLVDTCLAEESLRQRFRFELTEGPDRLAYAHHDRVGTGAWPHSVSVSVRIVDRPWRLRLAPSAANLARAATGADEAMASAALLLVGCLAFALYSLLRRQDALEESRAKYRLLVEHQSDLVVKLDPLGRFLYVSPSYCETFGMTEGELLGREITPLVHEEDREATARAMDALRRPPHRVAVEQRVMTRDGWRWLAWSKTAVLGADDGVEAIICVGRDVTQRRELEEQLVQSRRLHALGQLTGGIAHDFNNILQGMMGSYEFLRLDLEGEGRTHRDLEQIGRSLERARQLTAQLLAFGRRQVLEPEDLELNRTIEDMLHLLRRAVSESVSVELEPAAGPLFTRVDRGQVEQILMNLCVNARDAVDGNGRVVISTSSTDLDAAACADHEGLAPGRYVAFTVADTGRGMPPEVLERAFEPFFTTKPPGSGTGLGLATVHGIVRQHGGLVLAESVPGAGSRFTVLLPAIEAPRHVEPGLREEAAGGGDEAILLAEDDDEVREQLARLLEEAGYRVLTAADGEEAVEIFGRHRDEVDLVLLDVVMPRMGGRTAAERIRGLRPDIRVLFASGYDPDAVGERNLTRAGDGFLAKPYRAAALLAKVREVLDR